MPACSIVEIQMRAIPNMRKKLNTWINLSGNVCTEFLKLLLKIKLFLALLDPTCSHPSISDEAACVKFPIALQSLKASKCHPKFVIKV